MKILTKNFRHHLIDARTDLVLDLLDVGRTIARASQRMDTIRFRLVPE